MLLNEMIILIAINTVVGRKENMFWDLIRQGKSFMSRSFGFSPVNEPRVPNFLGHRDGHYYGLELFDDSVRNEDDDPDQGEYQINQHNPSVDDKKNDYKIISHTEIVENDNMDLYQFLGGISFASLLATTILILGRNRRNNAFTKSLEESLQSRGHHDGSSSISRSTYLSEEEILARLLSPHFKWLRKMTRKN